MKVLIIEDDQCLLTVLQRIIKKIYGTVEVDWVSSGEKVFSKIVANAGQPNRHAYDLVIADVLLDGVFSGLDIWSFFQDMKMDSRFLVISSLSPQNFLENVGQKTPPPFLKKPFTVSEFETFVRNVKAVGS